MRSRGLPSKAGFDVRPISWRTGASIANAAPMSPAPVLLKTSSEDGGQHTVEELMVSFQTPLPGNLHAAMGQFIEQHPQWDQYRLMQAALAGFLLQNGVQQRDLTRRYISSMFGRRG
jgi:hypothetical protein